LNVFLLAALLTSSLQQCCFPAQVPLAMQNARLVSGWSGWIGSHVEEQISRRQSQSIYAIWTWMCVGLPQYLLKNEAKAMAKAMAKGKTVAKWN